MQCINGTCRCGAGLTFCADAASCLNLATDPNNCGSCGHVCPAPANGSAVCTNGACGIACNTSYSNCNGACVNESTDVNNCGSCGHACSSVNGTPSCASGSCQISCNAGYGDCDGTTSDGCETNTGSDVNNCGSCGHLCTAPANATPTCTGGTCGFTCNSGFSNCNGVCVNESSDLNNCGSCGHACPTPPNASPTCVSGACGFTCNPGFADCDGNAANGCETNIAGDPNNCSSCGHECAIRGTCTNGMCGCPSGYSFCNNNAECDNLGSDVNNCGACMNRCPVPANGSATCSGGNCGIACNSGYVACGGSCVATASDPNNCGSCGHLCTAPANATATCSSSTCGFTCNSGFSNCSGVCVNESSDLNNCGACAHACPAPANATATCSGGACGFTCNSGFTNCSGVCVNESSDVNNCGACGNACPAPSNGSATCANGSCGVACNTSFSNCSGACVNEASDANNCGSCGNKCTSSQSCQNGACVATCGGSIQITGLSNPQGVAVDSAGNVYVVDTGNARVQEYTSSGAFVRTIGAGQLTHPSGVTVDTAGDVFVSDIPGAYCQASSGRVIDEFAADGVTLVRSFPAAAAGGNGSQLYPVRLARSPDGTVWDASPFYIGAGCGPGVLQQLNTTTGGTNDYEYHYGVSAPSSVTVESTSLVYYSDGTSIYKFAGSFGGVNPTIATFATNSVNDIAAACDGSIWVALGPQHIVVQLSSSGSQLSAFGSLGTAAGQFNTPSGIAVAYPYVWVSDSVNGTLTRYNTCNSCPTGLLTVGAPTCYSQDNGLGQYSCQVCIPYEVSGAVFSVSAGITGQFGEGLFSYNPPYPPATSGTISYFFPPLSDNACRPGNGWHGGYYNYSLSTANNTGQSTAIPAFNCVLGPANCP